MTQLREPCEHGRYESHPLPNAKPTAYLGMAGQAFSESDICSGGREIKLKQVGPRMDDGWVIDYVDDAEKTWKMVETDET